MTGSVHQGIAAITLLASTTALSQDTGGALRLGPGEYRFPAASAAGAGTSGAAGIRSVVLKGDPSREGLYTILLSIPANTTIQGHSHRDDRVATVVRGDWSIGYGAAFDAAGLKWLAPGGYYTEPPGLPHFARTGPAGAVVLITGYGPTDTRPAPPASRGGD